MRRDQRGAVTAELCLVIPMLVAVTMALVWLLSAGLAQLRLVDGARETARALARGDEQQAAVSAGSAVAPEQTQFAVHREGDLVRVTARHHLDGPGGLVDFLAAVWLEAEAVAVVEAP